jgi:hypothetical protein
MNTRFGHRMPLVDPEQQSQPSASGRTYALPQAVQQQVMQPNIEQPPVVEETPADPTEWFTSVLQPYQPVFRKSQDSYKLEWKQADKEKIPFITIINGVPMDRRQHETAFQGIRRHDSDVNMFDGAEVTIARTSEPVVTAEDEAIESIASTFSSTTDSQWYQNSTLQDAVLNTNLIFECDGNQSWSRDHTRDCLVFQRSSRSWHSGNKSNGELLVNPNRIRDW